MFVNFLYKWCIENLFTTCNILNSTKLQNPNQNHIKLNTIFWFCLFFSITFQLYGKLLKVSADFIPIFILPKWKSMQNFVVFCLEFFTCIKNCPIQMECDGTKYMDNIISSNCYHISL